jgi:hypothetical protein
MHEECLIYEALGRQRKMLEDGHNLAAWEEFLEASLKVEQMGPAIVEFAGDRADVAGGVMTWTESVKWLLYGRGIS